MNDQTMILILVIGFFMLGCRFNCSGMKEYFSNTQDCSTLPPPAVCYKDSCCAEDICYGVQLPGRPRCQR